MSTPSPLMPLFAQQPVSFPRGEGAWLFDQNGRRYLDCLSGIACNTLGHNHPGLVAALRDQVGRIIHTSNLFEQPWQLEAAGKLVERAGMTNAFFCNSGLEANEAAIKLARFHGHARGVDNPQIIVFQNAFHGRSLATLSATGNVKVQKGFEPLVQGFIRAPFNDIESLRGIAGQHKDVVAVLIEPVQGEGGVLPAHAGFLKELRALCDSQGWLLMFDEVQCGTGRTGRWFASQWAEVVPDVISLAKGLGSGVPVGAILAGGEAAQAFTPGSHGSTFGGNPLAMRAVNTTIDVMESEGLLANAARIGEQIADGLRSNLKDVPGFVEVRGQGLMLGVVLDRPCTPIVTRALEQGLVLNVTADSVVRLLPPLIFNRDHADELVTRLSPLIQTFLERG